MSSDFRSIIICIMSVRFVLESCMPRIMVMPRCIKAICSCIAAARPLGVFAAIILTCMARIGSIRPVKPWQSG
jgi:hypothetical protein